MTSPARQVTEAVREVLTDRGATYTPRPGRSQIQSKMNDAVMRALLPFRPDGLPEGCRFVETLLAAKFTRALELGWNGGYHEDNTLDFGGYSACLAALVADTDHPADVLPCE